MTDRDTAKLVDAYDARTAGRLPRRPRDTRPRLVCPKCPYSRLMDPPRASPAAPFVSRACPRCGGDLAVVIP